MAHMWKVTTACNLLDTRFSAAVFMQIQVFWHITLCWMAHMHQQHRAKCLKTVGNLLSWGNISKDMNLHLGTWWVQDWHAVNLTCQIDLAVDGLIY